MRRLDPDRRRLAAYLRGRGLRTVMILFEGGYSGVVDLDRHAIRLERDLEFRGRPGRRPARPPGRDLAALDAIVASGRYTLRGFVAEFDGVVDDGLRSLAGTQQAAVERGSAGGAPSAQRLARGRALAARVARRTWSPPASRANLEANPTLPDSAGAATMIQTRAPRSSTWGTRSPSASTSTRPCGGRR